MTISWPAAPLRQISLAPAAFVITFLLLLLMHQLVYVKETSIETSKPLSFKRVFMPENRTVTPQPKEITKETEVEKQPLLPKLWSMPTPDETSLHGGPITLGRLPNPTLEGSSVDSGPIPTVRVAASYPANALRREIQGYVDVAYDISPTGATENVRVQYAEPRGYFEKAAIKAVERWKFKPQQIGGKTVAARGFVTRVTFEISDLKP